MNKIYKLLIVLTFLIGLFFLGKYAWAKIPKYEWQERMVVHEREFSFKDWCWDGENCYCQKVEIEDIKCLGEELSQKEIDKLWENMGAMINWDRTLNKHKDFCYWSSRGEEGENFQEKYYKTQIINLTKTICYIKEKVKIN